jgi:2'-5' RNA ligase
MKKEPALYSIVVFPSIEKSEEVKLLKQILRNKINWFHSCNSAAHVTIIELQTEIDYLMYIEQIRQFCNTVNPRIIKFNSFNSFKYSGAFYIAADERSKSYLDKIIIDLHNILCFQTEKLEVNSHMTIARKLKPNEMEITWKLFSNIPIDLKFVCDALYVRRFNQDTKQYSDVVEKISFGNT